MKLKCGDWVTLSSIGIEKLEDTRMSINERIQLTRLFNHGGKVTKLFPEHVEVIAYNPQGELGTDPWLVDFRKISPQR